MIINVNLDDVIYKGPDFVSLNKIFEDLEFKIIPVFL